MKLRKDKWCIVQIGSIVSELRNTSNNPIEEGFIKYVGFEHIEPENINLKQFGDLNDGVTFKKTFKKNDVLFGKIRAYLKKVVIAPIDGICSGDILVLRTKDDKKLSQELLAYFLTTESFLKQAVDSSIGTTLPRTKWQHLSKHEFPLPPLEEQKQIASLFQSLEKAMEQVEGQEKNLLKLKNNLLKDLFNEKQQFGTHLTANNFETVRFDKVAINISERVEPKKTELTTYVGLEHLDADNLRIERTGIPDDVIGTKLKIYKGDIIFGKRRAYLRKLAVSHFDGIASAHSMILRANEKHIEKDFLPYFMQSDAFMSRAVQISEGSLSPTIKNKTLAQQEFTLPKKEKQQELIAIFKQFDLTMDQLRQQKTTLKNLKQKLLNEILG
ncbi:MAG: restriction endonuclease subunit S [Bacteroidota bacterium]|nr:restriction endonuclease subunit S [Bacteroidota bacterium]